jgi:hypothetical protein
MIQMPVAGALRDAKGKNPLRRERRCARMGVRDQKTLP